jgi:hypothetical protein
MKRVRVPADGMGAALKRTSARPAGSSKHKLHHLSKLQKGVMTALLLAREDVVFL